MELECKDFLGELQEHEIPLAKKLGIYSGSNED